MTELTWVTRAVATAAAGTLLLAGCGDPTEEETTQPQSTSETSTAQEGGDMAGHQHRMNGGPPPQRIEAADDPTYAVGDTGVLAADHMPGMQGTEATISGAYDTTAYSVTYTPTTGGEPVADHKWVVHEELEDPGKAPLPQGTKVVLKADHMKGMEGAEATIENSTAQTVYMVDTTIDGMKMTNHKWVVESEIKNAP